MNQIERIFEGDNYTLRLWSDAVYEVSTSAIKSLLNLATQRLEIQLEIDAYYHHIIRNWRVRFSWCLELSGRQSFEQNLDHSQVVCANPVFLERLAVDMGDRIRKSIPNDDSQNWVIVRHREGFLAGIHQTGKTSVNLILREVTQEFDYQNRLTLEIEAWNPGNAILRGDSVEVGGMLLQGELLEWLEIGQESWFRFSLNTQQVNTSPCSLDETRITFTTRPRINRLASFERISQMIEQGQIEIPRSGYFFDRLLQRPHHSDNSNTLSLEALTSFREEIATEISPNAINAIGDTTCQYNARSRMIRCAVNPCGPCEGCQHYEKI